MGGSVPLARRGRHSARSTRRAGSGGAADSGLDSREIRAAACRGVASRTAAVATSRRKVIRPMRRPTDARAGTVVCRFAVALACALPAVGRAADSFPPLGDGAPPGTLDAIWAAYDPEVEPLESETLAEWTRDGVVCRVVRYRIGTFKAEPATMVGFYTAPQDVGRVPGLLQIHGGGQSATLAGAVADAKRGYACLSINWGGNPLRFDGQQGVYDGPNTDWGRLDATHPPQRNAANHFIAGLLAPDDFTLDAVESPRNSNWFLVLVAARRGITFLRSRPEVDPDRIGVHGHSMGGTLTTRLAAIDSRVRAAVPSCGGAGLVLATAAGVPGCVKTRPTHLELACVADNAFIARLTCPILWLSPTNDFHAPIDNMAMTWRDLPDEQVRFSISPHRNHVHADEQAITQHLWFEQHLAGRFTMPRSPTIGWEVDPERGVPVLRVVPDASQPVRSLEVFYSTDPHVLTRFWRSADAVEERPGQWRAACPIGAPDDPLFAFANVAYDLPERYRSVAMPPGQAATATFVLSSRELIVPAATLAAAAARPTENPDSVIDDGSNGWRDWYRVNWDHPPLWRAWTRKPKDRAWRGPDGAALAFDIRCASANQLVVEVETNGWGACEPGRPAVSYTAVVPLAAATDWQPVRLTLDDFVATDPRVAAPLTTWRTVTQLGIGPSGVVVRDGEVVTVPGASWVGPREIRNLRWE